MLLDDAGIVPLNRSTFGSDHPTDVISLAYPPPAAGGGPWRGDVLVNAERARGEGAKRGSVARELALYVAHGCDHLAGADDATPAERRRMRRRELRWLRAAEREGILSGLLAEGAQRE